MPQGSLWLDRKWGGLFEQPWYNFSAPAAVNWWIDQGPIAEALREPYIDGVYLDGSDPDDRFYDENFNSVRDIASFKDAQRQALAKAVGTWRARMPHKWLGGYAAPRVKHEQQPNHCPPGSCAGPEQLFLSGAAMCATTMRLLVSRADWSNQTLIISTRHHPHDALAVATFRCKAPWWSQNCVVNSTRDPAPEVAAFLVARGPSALFQVVMQPPAPSLDYHNATAFPSLALDPGIPLEVHAREVRNGAFERRWSNLTVLFDCESYTGTFLPADSE